MVFFFKGDIFREPVGRSKGIGSFFCGKFHFCQDHAFKGSGEKIQFNGKNVIQRNEIAPFGDDIAVGFGFQMFVGLLCKGQIVFLMSHHAAGFIGQDIAVVLTADADHRSGTKILLLDFMVSIALQMFR